MNIKCKFVSAVIVAAGTSSRMGFDKLFAEIHGVPVIAATLLAFNECDRINEIIVVTRKASIEKMAEVCRTYQLEKVKKIIIGADNRCGSSLAGVSETNKRADIICIHDGARPFISDELINSTVKAACEYKAAAPGLVPKDTIKLTDGEYVCETLVRSQLRCIQTPQAFDAALIKAALTKALKDYPSVTDDCSAAENIGIKPYIIPGDERNIKLTTPDDIKFAEMIATDWKLKVRI